MVNALLLLGCEWSAPALGEWPRRLEWDACGCTNEGQCAGAEGIWTDARTGFDLIVTVGWRHLVPADILASTPLGVVGFHSALLPEYPGRAPVPWAILRGDEFTANTMLYLTDEPDAGDIIDRRTIPVTTAAEMNRRMGETAAEMLRQHLPALLTGTAPRTPQDRTRRGPLTTADGWQRLTEAQR
jgi:methionyl-tRNA formyltransferase